MTRTLALGLAGMTLLGNLGCGARAKGPDDPRILPDTAWDPSPYTPPPAERASTDQPSGLFVSTGHERARHAIIALVLAIRDGDGARLEELLADEVASLTPQLSSTPIPRERLVERILHHPRRNAIGGEIPLERLIDLGGLTVAPLARLFPEQPLPPGMRTDDVRVIVPLRPDGIRLLGALIGWRTHVAAIVRAGPDPIVLAL